MFARSTTFRGAPGDVEAGIAMVRDEVMPQVTQMEGCIGLSMLVDREHGSSIVTTAWESEDALRATEQRVAPMRDRAGQLFGSQPEVHVWEIAVLHRSRPVPEGACARVTWTRTEPQHVEQVLDAFRANVLPSAEALPGFCSLSLLIDRSTGEGASATTYESREALERSREEAGRIRMDATSRMPLDILDVAEFEVALAHLRVPETV